MADTVIPHSKEAYRDFVNSLPKFLWDGDPNPDKEKAEVRWDFVELHVAAADYEAAIAGLKQRGAFIRHINPPTPNKPSTDMTALGFKKNVDPDGEEAIDPDLTYHIKAWAPRPTQKSFF